MLEAREGRKYGYVVADDARFEILALNSEYSVMARVNPSFFGDKTECLELPEEQGFSKPQKQAAASRSGEACVIRVLFLYTQAAEDRFGVLGLNDMAALGISQTNQAFANSQVTDVCVARANFREWVGFAEDPNDIGQDMQDLLTDNVVAQWREDDLADVVCLITDAGYNDFLGLAGFIPNPNGPGIISNLGNPMFGLSFMIVESDSFNANFTFSHELGHVVGCRHQTCATFLSGGCDNGGAIEHGHGWGHRPCWLCRWKNYSTMMHQLQDGNNRLLRYSNPEINDKGATGVTGVSENAQWIRDGNGCTVADYFPDPVIPFSANIIGSDFICHPFSEIYSVGVAGAIGSLTYEWHISTDGVNWGNPVGANYQIELYSTNFAAGIIVFLRVRVTNQAGNSVFAFFNVLIKENNVVCFRSDGNAPNSSGQVFAAFPNPSDDLIQVTVGVQEDNVPVFIRLFSLTGVLLEERRYLHNPGTHTETLSLKSLPAGAYALRAQIGNMFFNKLIVKS
ncbi:MAG: zinc-dependent metalloprotease [Saprospiraceae bacterium]|nr:zinc-dependent metalloprotease [Saprospiraceae bacterium]